MVRHKVQPYRKGIHNKGPDETMITTGTASTNNKTLTPVQNNNWRQYSNQHPRPFPAKTRQTQNKRLSEVKIHQPSH